MPSNRSGRSVAVTLCIALAVTLLGCSSSESANEYPDEVRETFIEACAAQPNATTEMCSTCLDVVEAEYSYEEFIELDTALQAGTATEEESAKLFGIMAECA